MVKRVDTGQTNPVDTGAALLASPVRRSIVASLERFAQPGGGGEDARAGGMTAAQLAEELGLHVTTVRFHLDQLELAGLVLSHFTTVFGVGRPRKVYAAAPSTDLSDHSSSHLKLLAGLLSASYSSDLTPEQAGEQWAHEHIRLERTDPATTPGAWLTKLGRLIDVLQRWGYTPNLTTTDGGRSCRIDLVACPFMDLARANPDVVCGIHRGLLAGALDQMGENQVDVSLQPFVGPSLCHAHLSTSQRFEPPTEESPDEP
jgi:predicted ArsR family transcriptional regulator